MLYLRLASLRGPSSQFEKSHVFKKEMLCCNISDLHNIHCCCIVFYSDRVSLIFMTSEGLKNLK